MKGLKGLSEKVALVTGGSSGIGQAICERLADEGVNVAIFDLNSAGAEAVAASIRERGCKAHCEVLDISDYEAVEQGVARAEAALGPIDLLVNCAGKDTVINFLDSSPAMHDKAIAINLKGPVNVTHVVVKGMAERKFGRVVFIASDAGRVGSSGQAVYSACKGGVISMVKTLARELSRKNITFNAIAPGPTRTPMMEAALDGGDGATGVSILQKMIKLVPLNRIGEPEDVAGIATFLCSDEASFITGQVLSVSGGLSMHG